MNGSPALLDLSYPVLGASSRDCGRPMASELVPGRVRPAETRVPTPATAQTCPPRQTLACGSANSSRGRVAGLNQTFLPKSRKVSSSNRKVCGTGGRRTRPGTSPTALTRQAGWIAPHITTDVSTGATDAKVDVMVGVAVQDNDPDRPRVGTTGTEPDVLDSLETRQPRERTRPGTSSPCAAGEPTRSAAAGTRERRAETSRGRRPGRRRSRCWAP